MRTAVLEKTWPYLNVQTGSKTTGAGCKPGMHMLSLSEIQWDSGFLRSPSTKPPTTEGTVINNRTSAMSSNLLLTWYSQHYWWDLELRHFIETFCNVLTDLFCCTKLRVFQYCRSVAKQENQTMHCVGRVLEGRELPCCITRKGICSKHDYSISHSVIQCLLLSANTGWNSPESNSYWRVCSL